MAVEPRDVGDHAGSIHAAVVSPPRRVRSRLAAGEVPLGISIQTPSAEVVEAAGFCGADFVYIDAEHSALSIAGVSDLVRAAWATNTDSLVRVPSHDASYIGRVLDSGATGVIIPHVSSAAEAEQVVAATRFSPRGSRGTCPMIRAAAFGAEEWAVSSRRQDDDVFVWLMIEEPLPGSEIQAIVSTEGVDALSLGLADLKQTLGATDESHPVLARMIDDAREACGASGVALSTVAREGALAIQVVASDRLVLVDGFRRAVARGASLWTDRPRPRQVASGLDRSV